MSTKYRSLFVAEAFVLLLGAANARASILSLNALACVDGNCVAGTPAASGGDVIPGATGIGEGVSRHETEPGAIFDAFLGALGAEDYGIFRATASANVFGEANSGSPGESYGAGVEGTDTEQWIIPGGTGTGELALSWTISGTGSQPAAAVGGTTTAYLLNGASANGFVESTGDVTASGVYAGLGGPIPYTSTLTGAAITDAFGNPILGAKITSDAGIQIPLTPAVKSTPEPSSLTLVMLAMAAAGLARGYRRRAKNSGAV